MIAALVALGMVQFLAHGMVFPLREMVDAARAMARGDYSQRVTATSRDEVGELARAFNTMAAELAEVDAMQRHLIANASHELRTPIGALRATLENAVDGVEPVDPAKLLVQVERLGRLVEQLLDLSKLEAGVAPLARTQFAAKELLDHVVREWRPAAEEREVQLETAVEIGFVLDADEDRMYQVLANLVSNAIRHSPPGTSVLLRADARNGHARLEVADEGPGIPPDEAERVFERFYRADRARAATDGGSGLGLSIARWIVELHGGQIRAEQADPHGCRMVVELPR